MAMLKGMQFAVVVSVVCEKIAPGAIQFHALQRHRGGLYGSRTYGNR